MTDTNPQDKPTHTVVVPNSIDMVSVLGPGDEHLRLIERAFEAAIHVRGNRITAWMLLVVFGLPVVFTVMRIWYALT